MASSIKHQASKFAFDILVCIALLSGDCLGVIMIESKKPMRFKALPGLSVSVDSVTYEPHLNADAERPHPFVYHLSIHNESDSTVTILGRKWIVTDNHGGTLVVEGDGVVGQTPRLDPGHSFSYNSYHVIKHPSMASGTFFGQTDDGTAILVRVPDFTMQVHRPG